MPQRFYLDENDLIGQLERLDKNLYTMLEFAYLHEDMITTIEDLMSEWGSDNLQYFSEIKKEWEELSDDDKDKYEEFGQFLYEFGRWWIETDKLTQEEIIKLINRYQITIATALHSDTYCYETIKENIEQCV